MRSSAGFAIGLALVLGACSSATTASPSASAVTAAPTVASAGDVLVEAQADVKRHYAATAAWNGPTTGPAAQPAATIVFVSADGTNGGINGVLQGVSEAGRTIGWTIVPLDGQGSAKVRAEVLAAAIERKPAGIIAGGFDPAEQQALIDKAKAAGIPIVGWHAGAKAGADPTGALFANVTTDPLEVAMLAADYVIADAHVRQIRAGVAIFTDGQYQIALDKADAMKARLERCAICEVVAYRDSPISQATTLMPGVVQDLRSQFGGRLTYLLAINGNYFGGTRLGLREAGVAGTDAPYAVAAGDGDTAEFDRIRGGDYQQASIAEPLLLQGWQLVDELNRARAGEGPSAYLAQPGLITVDAVPDPGKVFDPSNATYRAAYQRIWGVGG